MASFQAEVINPKVLGLCELEKLPGRRLGRGGAASPGAHLRHCIKNKAFEITCLENTTKKSKSNQTKTKITSDW